MPERGKLETEDGSWKCHCKICGEIDVHDVEYSDNLNGFNRRQKAVGVFKQYGWRNIPNVGWICDYCGELVDDGDINLLIYKKQGQPIIQRGDDLDGFS